MEQKSIAYLTGRKIALEFIDWDLDATPATCMHIAEKEGWDFTSDEDRKDFYQGVKDAKDGK